MRPAERAGRTGQLGRLSACLVAALLLSSCGGGGGGGDVVSTAPTISNLTYGPLGTYQGSSGGTARIAGSVRFTDPDGDLAGWTLTVVDQNGQVLQSTTSSIPGATGLTEGVLNAQVIISTAATGTFTFGIKLTDAQGQATAPLTGTFRVTTPPWTTLPAMPVSRTGFASALVGGRVYLMGGTMTSTAAGNRVDIFDLASQSWQVGVPMMQAGVPMNFPGPWQLQEAGAAVVDGKIIVIGTVLAGASVQEFDPATGVWRLRAPPPAWRPQASTVGALGRVYYLGGGGGIVDSADNDAFDPVANLWRKDTPMPTGRVRVSALAVDLPQLGGGTATRVFALGGRGSTAVLDAGYLRTNESFDPVGQVWQVRAPMPVALAGIALAALDGQVYAFGGDNVERSNALAMRYDPVADRWTMLTPMPGPLAGARAEVVGRKIYVFGQAGTYVYSPDDDLW